MGRILAIDYGLKRSGIAVTDPLKIIAKGLTTVPTASLLGFLAEYMTKEEVEALVVGEPRQMNNMPSETAPAISEFVRSLEKKFPGKPVYRIDERFTSRMAMQTMIDSGLKKKARQDKRLVDEISAAIILQSFLEKTK